MAMSDTDKIVAAIFAATMCGQNPKHDAYLQAYDGFIELMAKREKEKNPPLNTDAMKEATRLSALHKQRRA
jgi:truncated hemoglobin YjbI